MYGKISIDALGKVRPETKNATLVNMLEFLNVTENKYSGIPTMRSEFANSGLPAPLFSVVHGEFKVVMKNSSFAETMPVADSLVDFYSIPRSRSEIVAFVGKSQNHVMSQIVAPLIVEGKLKMTMPDKPKSSNQKFIKAQ